MVTRPEVETAYGLLFGRMPESDEAMAWHMSHETMVDFMRAIMDSREFQDKFGRPETPLDWPPSQVEVAVDPAAMAGLFAHVEQTWRGLGDTDAFWSVLSQPKFKPEQLADNIEVFRDGGRSDVGRLRAFAARSGIDLAQFKCCFELGCGVGRTTRWLAKTFPRVIAGDISASHLRLMREEVGAAPVEGVLLTSPDAIGALPEYDVFFSCIVLQHNPPPIMALMLRAALTRLSPGGVGFFQVPTYSLGYTFETKAYAAALPAMGEMEMHVLPQRDVFAIAAACGCVVLEVREDGAAGNLDGVSNTFLVQKSGIKSV